MMLVLKVLDPGFSIQRQPTKSNHLICNRKLCLTNSDEFLFIVDEGRWGGGEDGGWDDVCGSDMKLVEEIPEHEKQWLPLH